LSLASELTLGYLHDFTLGGNVASVAQDVSRIAELGSKMDLVLNAAKCEFVAHSVLPSSSVLQSHDTRCFLNVRSKTDKSQLNLPHGTNS